MYTTDCKRIPMELFIMGNGDSSIFCVIKNIISVTLWNKAKPKPNYIGSDLAPLNHKCLRNEREKKCICERVHFGIYSPCIIFALCVTWKVNLQPRSNIVYACTLHTSTYGVWLILNYYYHSTTNFWTTRHRHRHRLKYQRTEKIVIDKNSFRVNKNRNVGKTKTIPHRTKANQSQPNRMESNFGMKSKEVKTKTKCKRNAWKK